MNGPRRWRAAYLAVVAAFLVTVATYYHRDSGFTYFIEFPIQKHETEIPAVRAAPHHDHPQSGGYDGQFYAQIAVEPLLRDPAIDRAVDTPAYRARRILVPWLSYAAGLGRPAWILQAYALNGVVAWLLLAWLITRWIDPGEPRRFVLAATALVGYGPLMSVRYALPDLAAAVLVAAAVLASERGRPLATAAGLGAAGLARDTSLAALGLFARLLDRRPASWLKASLLAAAAAVPLLVWLDYLYSVYVTRLWMGSDLFVAPFTSLAWKLSAIGGTLAEGGLSRLVVDDAAALAAFLAQSGWLVWRAVRHRDRSPWVLAGLGFVAVAAVADRAVWEGFPGAYPRVVMPAMIAAHATLARQPAPPWWLIGLVSLDAVPGVRVLAGG